MSTHDKTTPVTTRWAVPGVAVIAGLAYLAAGVSETTSALGLSAWS